MGMFDSLHCHHPLPFTDEMRADPALCATLQAAEYQTKDLHCYLDQYELRADGTLWVYRRGDEGLEVPANWVLASETLSWIRFYTSVGQQRTGWVEWKMAILDGRLLRPIELVMYRPVDPVKEEERAKDAAAFYNRPSSP